MANTCFQMKENFLVRLPPFAVPTNHLPSNNDKIKYAISACRNILFNSPHVRIIRRLFFFLSWIRLFIYMFQPFGLFIQLTWIRLSRILCSPVFCSILCGGRFFWRMWVTARNTIRKYCGRLRGLHTTESLEFFEENIYRSVSAVSHDISNCQSAHIYGQFQFVDESENRKSKTMKIWVSIAFVLWQNSSDVFQLRFSFCTKAFSKQLNNDMNWKYNLIESMPTSATLRSSMLPNIIKFCVKFNTNSSKLKQNVAQWMLIVSTLF